MPAFFEILTAEGRGAIAVVRVRGPGALDAADSVFRPHRGRSLRATPPGRLRLGRAGVGVGDEVVAVRLDGPPPAVEIHCHGGAAAVAAVARALEEAGAVGTGGDFTPPGLNQESIQAQAMEDLAAAPTMRTAAILLDQVHGALGRALVKIRDEAAITAVFSSHSPILAEMDALLRRAEVGTRLLRGWKVVIGGRPNVGKSRLFNALAGFERSIVNPQAGVTRDVVSIRTAFDGWPVDLSDTAGDRESEDAIEQLGIGRARRERRDADLVLLVLDRSVPLEEVDRELLETTASPMVVANKSDLPPAWDPRRIERGDRALYSISAETGDGLDGLVRAIASRLVPVSPPAGAAVPFRAEQVRTLEAARACVESGDRRGFAQLLSGDFH